VLLVDDPLLLPVDDPLLLTVDDPLLLTVDDPLLLTVDPVEPDDVEDPLLPPPLEELALIDVALDVPVDDALPLEPPDAADVASEDVEGPAAVVLVEPVLDEDTVPLVEP
jgi:hypothetical protein